MYETKQELSEMGIGKLKILGKKYNIIGLYAYNAGNKQELADKIHKAILAKKRAEKKTGLSPARKSPTKRQRSPAKSIKLADGLSCDMKQSTCKTSPKYKKADIEKLAISCGIADVKGKSRKNLCKEIEDSLGAAVSSGGISQRQADKIVDNIEDLEDMTKKDIMGLCKKIKAPCKQNQLKADMINTLRNSQKTVRQTGHKQPTPVKQFDGGCYGGWTYDELLDISLPELHKLLSDAGVTNGHPTTKKQVAAYLCSIEQNGTCDPENNIFCDEGQVCDAKSGVCLDEWIAGERINTAGLEQTEINGNKVIGPTKIIAKLRKQYGTQRAPQQRAPVSNCYSGKSYEELLEMKPSQLRAMLREAGVQSGIPTNPEEMVEYLCAIEQNGKCDPEHGIECNGDYVCDIKAKVCLDKKLAQKRKAMGLQTTVIDGKKFIGSPDALTALNKALGLDVTDVPDDDDDDDDVPDYTAPDGTEYDYYSLPPAKPKAVVVTKPKAFNPSDTNKPNYLAPASGGAMGNPFDIYIDTKTNVITPSGDLMSFDDQIETVVTPDGDFFEEEDVVETVVTPDGDFFEEEDVVETVVTPDGDFFEEEDVVETVVTPDEDFFEKEEEVVIETPLVNPFGAVDSNYEAPDWDDGGYSDEKTNEDSTPTGKLPENTDIIDVEQVLRTLQVEDGKDLGEIDKTRLAVLKCLGVIY